MVGCCRCHVFGESGDQHTSQPAVIAMRLCNIAWEPVQDGFARVPLNNRIRRGWHGVWYIYVYRLVNFFIEAEDSLYSNVIIGGVYWNSERSFE